MIIMMMVGRKRYLLVFIERETDYTLENKRQLIVVQTDCKMVTLIRFVILFHIAMTGGDGLHDFIVVLFLKGYLHTSSTCTDS